MPILVKFIKITAWFASFRNSALLLKFQEKHHKFAENPEEFSEFWWLFLKFGNYQHCFDFLYNSNFLIAVLCWLSSPKQVTHLISTKMDLFIPVFFIFVFFVICSLCGVCCRKSEQGAIYSSKWRNLICESHMHSLFIQHVLIIFQLPLSSLRRLINLLVRQWAIKSILKSTVNSNSRPPQSTKCLTIHRCQLRFMPLPSLLLIIHRSSIIKLPPCIHLKHRWIHRHTMKHSTLNSIQSNKHSIQTTMQNDKHSVKSHVCSFLSQRCNQP